MTNQQKLEKDYFDQFKLQYLLPDGEIIYSDRPDVIINGNQKIGIEITNYYIINGKDKTSEKRQKDIRNNILKRAQTQYLLSGEPNISLDITFAGCLKPENNTKIAKKIADMAINIQRFHEGEVDTNLYEHIPEIEFVYYRKTRIVDEKWRAIQSYECVPILNDQTKRLKSIIEDKNELSKQYQICDSYWLLIVMKYFDPAQYQDMQALEDYFFDKTYFSKIIIFIPEIDHIMELN